MRTFKIYAETLKTVLGESDGKRRLHGIASSTVKDRHGDVITLSAMQKMEQAATGMTIFFNHDYTVPESVAGTVEKAEIRAHPSDPDIFDLVYDIRLSETNPRAVQAWDHIQGGTQLGLSIGARIPNGGATKDADGVFTISDIELLETSIVGVPASPRSWVEYAVKSLRGDEEVDKTTSIKATPVDVEEPDDATETDDVVEQTSDLELEATDTSEGPGITVEEFTSGATSAPASDDAGPEEEAEPESEPTEDVTLDSDEVPTPQDAPESTPETGELVQSEETEVTLAALLSSADSLKSAHEVIARLDRDLTLAKTQLQDAEERAEVVVARSQTAMDATASLLDRFEKTSKGRLTSPVVIETKQEFDGLRSVYTDTVMSVLTKEQT